MRHDHDRAVIRHEERLEPCEAREVEIVRRLVEQKDVEPAEEDRGERSAGGLATGEHGERPVELGIEAKLGQHLLRARFEIAAATREEGVERLRVGMRLLGLVCEARGKRVHPPLGLGDAGTPREIRAQCLARERIALLRQVAHRTGRPNRAAIGRVEPGEQPQERRLAGAVRPHEPDPRLRRHDEIDAVEDDLGAVTLRHAGRGKHHCKPRVRQAHGNAISSCAS